MNFEEAIARHTEWKIIFRSAISKKELVDAATIRRDDCCILGKWLHGEGKSHHESNATFANLVTVHADFHQNAGRVADAINAGRYDEAETLIGVWSEYSSASLAVIDAIEAVRKDI
jgi:methyl-accepting chemotaxis protein